MRNGVSTTTLSDWISIGHFSAALRQHEARCGQTKTITTAKKRARISIFGFSLLVSYSAFHSPLNLVPSSSHPIWEKHAVREILLTPCGGETVGHNYCFCCLFICLNVSLKYFCFLVYSCVCYRHGRKQNSTKGLQNHKEWRFNVRRKSNVVNNVKTA